MLDADDGPLRVRERLDGFPDHHNQTDRGHFVIATLSLSPRSVSCIHNPYASAAFRA
jgi:hypothetical protein